MNNVAIKTRLEKLLDIPLSITSLTPAAWMQMLQDAGQAEDGSLSVVLNGIVYFRMSQAENQIQLLTIQKDQIQGAERSLIEWIIQSAPLIHKEPGVTKSYATEEQKAEQLGGWIQQQLSTESRSVRDQSLPDHIVLKSRMLSGMIPILVVAEYPTQTSYVALYKLLKSYFGGEVYVVPLLEKEWLILCPDELIFVASGEERDDDGNEKPEEILSTFIEGFHELLSSEWLGECHVAISHPIIPAKTILTTVALLRETIYLGRVFHITSNIHMPWQLHMERLLYSIPDEERRHFIHRLIVRSDVFQETETLTTLETFFSLDCNVSDTAKKLYIHRNTLLYRLDKIKQETGLDVRTFRDAVLVKLVLLLYKVTKK